MIPSPAGASVGRSAPPGATNLRFRVEDWAAYGPGKQSRAEWRAWAQPHRHDNVSPILSGHSLPTLLRRRISPVGQDAFRAADMLGQNSDMRFVFCSRHGEFQRTLGLMQAAAAKEPLSPAEFSLSVHNALAGLLSIAWKNRHGHTAVAAGTDSFGYGVLEAAACVVSEPERPVLLVYFDEALPGAYGELGEDADDALALALLIAPAAGVDSDFSLTLEAADHSDLRPTTTGPALDFLRFLLSDRTEVLSHGETIRWRWRREA